MKKILITSDKIRYFLEENEAMAVYKAINDGKKHIILHGDIVPLHITPSIVDVDRWVEQENITLRKRRQWMCKRCYSVYDEKDVRCGCVDVVNSVLLEAPKNNNPVRKETLEALNKKYLNK